MILIIDPSLNLNKIAFYIYVFYQHAIDVLVFYFKTNVLNLILNFLLSYVLIKSCICDRFMKRNGLTSFFYLVLAQLSYF